jgi:hypothetical protein
VLGPRFIFRRYVLVALTGGAIVAIGLDLGSNTRGFKDGPANSFPFQIAALPQDIASILKLPALFDGELGAGEQDIGHAAILPDRPAVAIKQVNPASSVVGNGEELSANSTGYAIAPRDKFSRPRHGRQASAKR